MMETMKVIDLLNKIANREEVHKKIKVFSFTYKYDYDDVGEEYTYLDENTNERLDNDLLIINLLNDEVEIIEDTPEEDKKIEKFKIIKDNSRDSVELIYDGMKLELTLLQAIILDKINEIIDKINGEK